MIRITIVFLALSISVLFVTPTQAQTLSTMIIYGYQPTGPSALGGTAWKIFADRVIDQGATERLSNFLADHNVPGDSSLYMNSDGGSLAEGMKLGRLIRQRGLFTYVGRSDPTFADIHPGECYSACALAFLGGVFRFIYTGSSYGVHRFYSPSGRDAINSDTAQIISAAVTGYIQEMGVNPYLFKFMTEAGPDEIKSLSDEEQLRLNVINNGEGPTTWTVESQDGILYLRGARQTWRGMNKFIMACPKKSELLLMVLYNQHHHGNEIKNSTRIHNLVIDGEYPSPKII